ncbi:nucleotidyltransferase family protein [Lentibacillus sp. CBA3610]|uniref:nucleotidyltransferase family protein n=1 Tax=Lentibacillus sp. CBA3610 TaxID=2518176 RepID=UPI0015960C70|nr:nucleotidyltransferase family protein [Lentibacillus sp. CBA3610]QKY69328.1 hypothetical protein Len3610_06680 [Lentibacillus sp. CBA3610]
MDLKSEKDILKVINEDDWMMDILTTVKSLNLPDWWVCAGFVRSKIWDILHGYSERTPMPDIDVIYFDDTNISETGSMSRNWTHKMLNLPAIPTALRLLASQVMKGTLPFHYLRGC